jgi:hypothetical protein
MAELLMMPDCPCGRTGVIQCVMCCAWVCLYCLNTESKLAPMCKDCSEELQLLAEEALKT